MSIFFLFSFFNIRYSRHDYFCYYVMIIFRLRGLQIGLEFGKIAFKGWKVSLAKIRVNKEICFYFSRNVEFTF